MSSSETEIYMGPDGKEIGKLPQKAFKKVVCQYTIAGKRYRCESKLYNILETLNSDLFEILACEFPELRNLQKSGIVFETRITDELLIQLSNGSYVFN